MTKIKTIIILILLLSNQLKAQDYHLFSWNDDVIYEWINENYCYSKDCFFEPAVKNKFINGVDTVVTFRKVLRSHGTYTSPYYTCQTFADTSFFGQQLLIKNDFTFEFTTVDGNTVIIKPQKNINETWVAYQYQDLTGNYIEAKVIAVQLDSVLNSIDSIKTINFTAKDSLGNTFPHAINQQILEISKSYGLVKTPHFLHFPNDTSHLELIAHSKLHTPFRNIKWKDIHDFNVGDEFHIRFFTSQFFFNYSSTYEKKIVLAKDSTNTEWIYTIDREYYLENDLGDTTYFRDTLIETYSFWHYSDTVSLRELFTCDPYGSCSKLHWTINQTNDYNRTMKVLRNDYGVFQQTDSCLIFTLGTVLPDTFYLEGLGGGYYHAAETSYDRVLQYYKKGNETWGTPINFGLYSTIKNIQTNFLTIFPNPSSNQIRVKIPEKIVEGKLRIFDVTGQLMLEQQLNTNRLNNWVKIAIKNWSTGLYIVHIQSNNGIWKDKFMKN